MHGLFINEDYCTVRRIRIQTTMSYLSNSLGHKYEILCFYGKGCFYVNMT